MQATRKAILGFAGGLAIMLAGLPIAATAQSTEGGLPAHTYVTVRAKNDPDPAISKDDLQLKEAGKLAQVTGWSQVEKSGKSIELAFIIDDSLRANVGNQLDDIKTFFKALPPSVSVLVGYMQNGHVAIATKQGFTNDHAAAIAALRVPMGVPGGNASPYFCVSDFVRRWPSPPNGKVRAIFMITNGVDNYTGTNPLNQDSPYVDDAIHDAQKAGVLVYSLYYPDSGVGGGRASFSGQGYLSKIAEQTGAATYYEGSFSPVSFDPYLRQFYDDLGRLYELEFLAPKTGLQAIKLSTNVKGIKLIAPDQVLVGEGER